MKAVADYLASPMTHIINHCIATSTVPTDWKVSRVCPVPKVNNPTSISEYRPISILPILSKVFERVIFQQITEHIEASFIYDSKQSGFRKGHSTSTVLLKLKDDIRIAMSQGEVTLAILADFSKAFDTVDYQILLRQLHQLGFSKNVLLLFKEYLSDRQQFVQVNDKVSEKLKVDFGVPQGSILGPILFNLYVASISSNGASTYLLYADDTTLLRHTKPKDLPRIINEMQQEMVNINIWSEERNLCLNALKTKTILFSTSQLSKAHKLDDLEIEVNSKNNQLEHLTDVKVLGVYFNQHLSWNHHVNTIIKSCYATLKSLKSFRKTADFKLRKSLVQSLILSKIDYCNVLLKDAPKYLIKRLQKIQNAAAGFVLCRKANESDVTSLRWLPVHERICSSLANLAHKALHDPSWPDYLQLANVTPGERTLRSNHSTQGNVDVNSAFSGSFVECAGSCFNALPLNVKLIDDHKIFKRKCFNYYFDVALSRILSYGV